MTSRRLTGISMMFLTVVVSNASVIMRHRSNLWSFLPSFIGRRSLSSTNSLKPQMNNDVEDLSIMPSPKIPHVTLDKTNVREQVYVVGDIHGCLVELKDLLKKIEYNPHCMTIILAGDLVNKAPFSAEVVKYARENHLLCVRGNHDEACLAAALAFKYGGKKLPERYAYIQKLSDKDIEWLTELPYTITLSHLNTVIVHAGLMPNVPLKEQLFTNMCKMRNIVKGTNGEIKATEKAKEGDAWASLWRGPEHVIFGHDAKRGLQLEKFATGLDTGCCYGRFLSCVLLQENKKREIIQIEAQKVWTKPGG